MAKCLMCGICCRCIAIDSNIKIDSYLKSIWIEISSQIALRINPVLKYIKDDDTKFYECTKLINNKCSIHNNKPDVCKNYPSSDGKSLKHPKCGFFDERNEIDRKIKQLYIILNSNYYKESKTDCSKRYNHNLQLKQIGKKIK